MQDRRTRAARAESMGTAIAARQARHQAARVFAAMRRLARTAGAARRMAAAGRRRVCASTFAAWHRRTICMAAAARKVQGKRSALLTLALNIWRCGTG